MFKPFLIKLSLGQYCQELPDHLGEGQEGIRSTACLLIFISAPSTTSQSGAVQSLLDFDQSTASNTRNKTQGERNLGWGSTGVHTANLSFCEAKAGECKF